MRHLPQILLALTLILNGSAFGHATESHEAMSAQSDPCHGEPPGSHDSSTQPGCCAGSGCVCASPTVAAVDAVVRRLPAPEHAHDVILVQSGEPLCVPDSLLRPPIA